MNRFSNTGWEYYEQMLDINPSSAARGEYAFSPIIDRSTSTSNTPPLNDPSLDNPSLDGPSLDDPSLETCFADFNMDGRDGDDDIGSATAIDNGSSTLISAPPSSKRKAISQLGRNTAFAPTHTVSNSAPPTSSAASQTGSSKRRKGSKLQESAPDLNDVRFQQMVNSHDHLTSTLENSFKMVNIDPLADEQTKATTIVKNDTKSFTLRQRVSLISAFSKNPRTVTGFLACADDLELRNAYAADILDGE